MFNTAHSGPSQRRQTPLGRWWRSQSLLARTNSPRAFGQLIVTHIRTQWVAYAIVAILLAVLNKHYIVNVNATTSLNYSWFVVERNAAFAKGDIVAFHWLGGGPYAAGSMFGKRVVGMPGDVVTHDGQKILINGRLIATAKTHSRQGDALALGSTGVIPNGFYHVHTDHPDSLDSRYALSGWIARDRILGKSIWQW